MRIYTPEGWRLATLALLHDCIAASFVVFAMFVVSQYLPSNDNVRYNIWVGRVLAVSGLVAAVGAALGPWLVVKARWGSWSPSALRVAPIIGPASVGGAVLGFCAGGLSAVAGLPTAVGAEQLLWDMFVVLAAIAGGTIGAIVAPLFAYARAAQQ